MYLVDTNIISAAAPARPASPALVEWMDGHSGSLFLPVVTVAEVEDGIAKSRREGATRKSSNLASWLETVLHLYGDRVLVSTRRLRGLPVRWPTGREGRARRQALPTSSLPRQRNITG